MSSRDWPQTFGDKRFMGHEVCSKKEIDFMCSKCPGLDNCKKSTIMGDLIPEPEEVKR